MLKFQVKRWGTMLALFLLVLLVNGIVYAFFNSIMKSNLPCYIVGGILGLIAGLFFGHEIRFFTKFDINPRLLHRPINKELEKEEHHVFKEEEKFWLEHANNGTFVKKKELYKSLVPFIITFAVFLVATVVCGIILGAGTPPEAHLKLFLAMWPTAGITYWLAVTIFLRAAYRVCKQCHSVNSFICDKNLKRNNHDHDETKDKAVYETIGAVYQDGKRIDTITQYSGTIHYTRHVSTSSGVDQYRCMCCNALKKEWFYHSFTGDWKQK